MLQNLYIYLIEFLCHDFAFSKISLILHIFTNFFSKISFLEFENFMFHRRMSRRFISKSGKPVNET